MNRFLISFARTSLVLTALVGCVSAASAQSLVWSDEFNGAAGSPPNPVYWGYDLGGGGWGNGELETYTNSTANCAQDGLGHLVITALQPSAGVYTSARIRTLGLFELEYGTLEASIQLPAGGQGLWPGFWSLGTTYPTAGWPACGEIDVMENYGSNPYSIFGTIHGPQSGTADGDYNNGAGVSASYSLPGSVNLSSGFHVYAVSWTPNQIQWSVDGNVYSTLTPASLPGGSTWVFNNAAFYPILNLAVAGTAGHGGAPTAATSFPSSMLIDYVRVYNTASAPTGGTAPAVPGTVDADVYDLGGEGCGYLALPGVSTEACTDSSGNGADVNQTAPGEWLNYTVNVATTSSYSVAVRVASAAVGGSFHFAVDGVDCGLNGVDQFPVYTVPDTGADQAWTTVTIPSMNLTAGTHVLRLQMNAAGSGGTFVGNFNDFTFTLLGTPTISPTYTLTATVTPTFTPVPHGPVVANFESPQPDNLTLWNSGKVFSQLDGYGSTLSPNPWTATSATAGGAYGQSAYSGCFSGTLAKSVGTNYPYCELELELLPGGSASGAAAPATDVTPWCPNSALTFDYKSSVAGVGYTVSLITPDVGDYGYYQYAFTAADTQWHTVVVYFPSSASSPKFAQPSYAAPVPFTETQIGAVQFSVNSSTTTSIPYGLCVDNVTFGQGTVVSPTQSPSFTVSPTTTPYAGTATRTPTPSVTPTLTATHGPMVDNFENPTGENLTLWNGGPVGTTADSFGSTLSPLPWTATSGAAGGSYGTSNYSGCITGTIAKSVGTNYPYCELYLSLLPGGWGVGAPATDVTPWALSQSLTFDYKGSPGVGYTVALITPDVYDYGYYQYSFTAADSAWHTVSVYFPTAPYSPQFDQPSFAATEAFTATQIGAIQFSVNALTSTAQAYSLCVDNVTFGGGIQASATPSPTSTASPSATPSRSPSPTASQTATPSASRTATATGTFSATPSTSPSATVAGSPTPSPSATPSGTPSATPSASPSATLSASPTPSATPSSTPSDTPSVTLSPTISLTATVSATFSVSPTQTQSFTSSPTLTASPSATPSATASPSPTSSPTATPTGSPTPTRTASPSATCTSTASPSATQSASATVTGTGTPSPTVTQTGTATPSSTVSPTASPSATVTRTFSPGPTATVSPTASPSQTQVPPSTQGPSLATVLRVVPVPNPQAGPQLNFYVQLLGGTDSMGVSLYDSAMVKVGQWELQGDYSAGWNRVSVPGGSLANGVYFVLVHTTPSLYPQGQKPSTLVILR